jgi:hypothetical protein
MFFPFIILLQDLPSCVLAALLIALPQLESSGAYNLTVDLDVHPIRANA